MKKFRDTKVINKTKHYFLGSLTRETAFNKSDYGKPENKKYKESLKLEN